MSAVTVNFDQPRTIHVERLEVLKSGRNRANGRPWTLYRVWASENGIPIPEELRTFSKLTGDVEVTAEAFIDPDAKTITHYTLRPTERAREKYAAERAATPASAEPDTPETGGLARIDALEERVQRLEQQLEVLSNVVLARATE